MLPGSKTYDRLLKKVISKMISCRWLRYGFVIVIFCSFSFPAQGKTYRVFSPDEKIELQIFFGQTIEYSVSHRSRPLVLSSPISLTLLGGETLGSNPELKKVRNNSVNETIRPVIREKRAQVIDCCEEIVFEFSGDYGLIFRVYNDGIAYRFFTQLENRIKIQDEKASFRFAGDFAVHFPIANSFHMSFENTYTFLPLSEISDEKMAFAPVLVLADDGPKVAVTEADLDDYPGMFLRGSKEDPFLLSGMFAPFPLKEELKRDRTLAVVETAEYIAETSGRRTFPWRVLLIAEEDELLVESDLLYRLAPSLELSDTSWIRPGKVAWDWWNALNLYGVDFESGINTATYKNYIEFASEFNIEYVILDEGWSETTDLLKINPDIDLKALLDYAGQKNVGLILWCVWITLDKQLEEALDAFEEWGVKGIKVDFMDRDDQKVVNYYRRVAAAAAERKLIVDFHGAYKPTGLRRAYPNILTREGVLGLEYSKWSDRVTPEHDLLIPFIRMTAGPMDFTPGAMINTQKSNFRAVFTSPMSQGTRVHQLAMFVVYESPLQMLCDSPSNYKREPVMMQFLSRVPTVWDETVVLNAHVGDFLAVARKKGEQWFVGAMTDWDGRRLEIDFGFLTQKAYSAEVYSDGPNAARMASDFTKSSRQISPTDHMEIALAPGGGWVAVLTPIQ
jgi:alpha-glucosidase